MKFLIALTFLSFLSLASRPDEVRQTIPVYPNPYLLQGEAGSVCGEIGMVIVGKIWERNKNWNRDSYIVPTALAIKISRSLGEYPDYSNGAIFLWSLSDLELLTVQDIIRKENLVLVVYHRCAGGLALIGYANQSK